MQDIDFLPANYRHVRSRRTNRYWCVIVAGVLGLSFAAATAYQYRVRSQIRAELARIEPQYVAAIEAANHLQELRQQATVTSAQAELVTYLGHRYPASRILATVFEPLPDSVTLDELVVQLEEISQAQPKAGLRRRQAKLRTESDEEKPQGPPAVADLAELREENDTMRLVVILSGKTRRSSVLHRYVSELGSSDLIAKAEVSSIETVADKSDATSERRLSKFTARIVLHAGHGHPGGVSETIEKTAATHSLARRRRRP